MCEVVLCVVELFLESNAVLGKAEYCLHSYLQCRIKVGAIDAAALGPLLKTGPPS